jgi:transcription antitermination factor NusG
VTSNPTQIPERQETPAAPVEWYALYTRHQHEKVVAEILSAKGFDVFLPVYETVRRWKDRQKQLAMPLFPCYVFLRGGLDRRVDVVTTPGLHSIVGAERPAAIPEAEIEAIRIALETRIRIEPHPFLRCGDWVRVRTGPLAGVEGILVRKKNAFRLVLSVELLGKSVAVEVDASAVERIPPRRAGAALHMAATRAGLGANPALR